MPVINTNVASHFARTNFAKVEREMDVSIQRLSSGLRVNRAADDAAGSAIIGRMDAQINGLNMNVRNIRDGQSYINTMEGAMAEVSSILQRMRELAVQAANGVATVTDNGYLQLEMDQLIAEVDAIADDTRFNDVAVLSSGGTVSFYTDIDIKGTEVVVVTADMHISVLGVTGNDVSVATQSMAQSAINNIDAAIAIVDSRRAQLGAVANRMDHIVDNLSNIVAETASSKSRIQDADFAIETTNLTRNTVLSQAATSMVAQANAAKNSILQLIQN
jgi:flagellin